MANSRVSLSRRQFTFAAMAASAAFAVPGAATALTVDDARALVGKTIDTVNTIINSGKSESAMIKDFEAMFAKYADVAVIARSALGPAARTASAAELAAFTKSFRGYISRKYGRRFREFIGGRIEVTDARPLKSYFEVISVAYLQGEAPFDLRWHVSDKSGKNLFFNLIIEGVNMLATERAEIGALLDKQGGSVGKLAEALKSV
jgi:phospholipid transport system substrate-binding protein